MGRKSDHGIAVTATANGTGTGYMIALRGVWPGRLKLAARLKNLRPDRYLEEILARLLVEDLLDVHPARLSRRDGAIAAGEDFREVCKR